MTDNQQKSSPGNDDLDLVMLFEKLYCFFRNYFVMLAVFTIAGLAAGFAAYTFLPKQYASSMLLHSYTLTNNEQVNIIENWNELIKHKEYATLAQRWNCSADMAAEVSEISAAEIQKLYSENNPNGFNVEVLVNNNAILDSLQKGIVYGLENSEYMKERLATKRDGFRQLIEKVKTEISKLDSTKNSISNNTQHAASYILDISGINTQMIALNEKLLNYQEQLKFMNAVQVLHPFEKFHKPEKPKLIKSVALGMIAGFALGYIIAVFLSIQKKIRRRRN